MTKEKRNTILRAVIPFLVLLLVGVLCAFFGFAFEDGKPTTFQLIFSLAYGGVTLVASLILGVVRKKGFFYPLLAHVLFSFPLLPTSAYLFSPLYALIRAFDAGEWVLYVFYSVALLALYGIGVGIRTLLSKYWNSDSASFVGSFGGAFRR